MKTKKPFDCVEMKRDIQANMRKEFEGLSSEEMRNRIRRQLEADESPVGDFYRRAASSPNAEKR